MLTAKRNTPLTQEAVLIASVAVAFQYTAVQFFASWIDPLKICTPLETVADGIAMPEEIEDKTTIIIWPLVVSR